MKYLGSKRRVARHVLPIILEGRRPDQVFVEPFCGGCNITERVDNPRVAADVHPELIALYKALQDGWQPPQVFTERDYAEARLSCDPVLRGWAGFCLSYGGKFWGGWCRDSTGKRNYVEEAIRNINKQRRLLVGCKFVCVDYRYLDIPSGAIVYCDPPYQGTTGYSHKFDHEHFWGWCRWLRATGYSVFVSEYTAPDDFQCVWSSELLRSVGQPDARKVAMEKLFC